MFKGTQEQEKIEYELFVGMETFEVIAFNPETKEEVSALLGIPEDKVKEPVYNRKVKTKVKRVSKDGQLEEDEEEVDEVILDFYLKGDITGKTFRHQIRIKDVDNLSYKEFESKGTVKPQWINQVGHTSWCVEKNLLKQTFTHFIDKKSGHLLGEKNVRIAKQGEEELYLLLNSWIGASIQRNWRVWEYDLKISDLFNGNFESLSSQVNGEFSGKFTGMLYVETAEDGEKQYQKIFSRKYMPGDFMKYIRLGFKFPNDYLQGEWNYFQKAVESPDKPEYSLKGYYKYDPVVIYDRTQDVTANMETKANISTNADY